MRGASGETNYFVPISNEVAHYLSAKRAACACNEDSHTGSTWNSALIE
jgi:hypothetical protein